MEFTKHLDDLNQALGPVVLNWSTVAEKITKVSLEYKEKNYKYVIVPALGNSTALNEASLCSERTL